jgi:hypothetical protein
VINARLVRSSISFKKQDSFRKFASTFED